MKWSQPPVWSEGEKFFIFRLSSEHNWRLREVASFSFSLNSWIQLFSRLDEAPPVFYIITKSFHLISNLIFHFCAALGFWVEERRERVSAVTWEKRTFSFEEPETGFSSSCLGWAAGLVDLKPPDPGSRYPGALTEHGHACWSESGRWCSVHLLTFMWNQLLCPGSALPWKRFPTATLPLTPSQEPPSKGGLPGILVCISISCRSCCSPREGEGLLRLLDHQEENFYSSGIKTFKTDIWRCWGGGLDQSDLLWSDRRLGDIHPSNIQH